MWHQWFNRTFTKATRILFVRKENKKNDFTQQFFSSTSPYSAILESIMMHARAFPARKQRMRVSLHSEESTRMCRDTLFS